MSGGRVTVPEAVNMFLLAWPIDVAERDEPAFKSGLVTIIEDAAAKETDFPELEVSYGVGALCQCHSVSMSTRATQCFVDICHEYHAVAKQARDRGQP